MSQRILFCAFSVALAASGCSGSSESQSESGQGGTLPVGGRSANASSVAGAPLRSGGSANALGNAGSPASSGAGVNAPGSAGRASGGGSTSGLAGVGLTSAGGAGAFGGGGTNAGRGPEVANAAGKSPISTAVTGGATGARQSGGANSAGNASSGNSSLASGGRGLGGKNSSAASSGNTAQSGAASGGRSATATPAPGGKPGSSGAGGAAGTPALLLPEENAAFDYQIGGNYTPPTGVRVVSRDRNSAPAAGLYNICYVNGFQIQPDEESFWNSQHPNLILKDGAGNPVVDEDWGEILLDTSTAAKRTELASVIGGWIAKCKADGYNAVEIDNLDSYSRSNGLLTQPNNVAFMALLSAAAHGQDLAIAQKNSSELLGSAAAMGTDFAVVEECNRYDECDQYQAAYGNRIFIIEYRSQDFQKGCAAYPELSIVLRDRNVSTPGSSGYVYQGC